MFIPSTTQLLLVTRPPDLRPTYDDVAFRLMLMPVPRRALRLVVSGREQRAAVASCDGGARRATRSLARSPAD